MMIDRFLLLTPAINYFLDNPNPTSLVRDDTLKVRETSIVNDMRNLLSYLHLAQEMLAGEQCPALSFTLPVFEDLHGALKELHSLHPKLMHMTYVALEKLEKYWEDCQGTHLYVLVMGMWLYIFTITYCLLTSPCQYCSQ